MRDAKWTTAGSVRCPNATDFGYAKRSAVSGDWIVYADEVNTTVARNARVIGRLTEMPNDGLEDCTGWLLVYELSVSLTYGYIRWVNPALVCEVYDHNRVRSCIMHALDTEINQLFEEALR